MRSSTRAKPTPAAVPGKARALYFLAPGRVELREEVVAAARPGEVLVRSRLIGVSHGTEMLAYRGQMPQGLAADATLQGLPGDLSYPLKYGYMNVGETQDGRRVFAFCPHQDLFAAPVAELVELPAELGYEDGVLLATMETAVSVVHDAAPRLGEDVLVVGQGMVGLLVAGLLRRCGAGRVLTVEPHALRRRASGLLGCIALEPAGAAAALRELTEGAGVDIAVDAAGGPEALQLALESLRFEGTLVAAAWYGAGRVGLGLGGAFHRRRLRIRSSQVSRLDPALAGRWSKQRRFALVLELLREMRPSRYITHRIPLAEAERAYALLEERPEETIQVVLEP